MNESIRLDLDEIARANPELDLDTLNESLEMQEQLRIQGYRPAGFRLDILGLPGANQFTDVERVNRQLSVCRSTS